MCRLLLMNAKAFDLIDSNLEEIFLFLMESFGGHGNGVAALWPDGSTRVAKSIHYDQKRAAFWLRRYRARGATWFLFHTRLASCGEKLTRNCHPFGFQGGRFILAHNGHDAQFAHWARLSEITDSECIARFWASQKLPLKELRTVRGVFIGFSQGHPFVIKGGAHTDLIAQWNDDGAMLFASELPKFFEEQQLAYSTPLGQFMATSEVGLYDQLFDPRSYYTPPVSTYYRSRSFDEYDQQEDLGEEDNLAGNDDFALYRSW